MLTDIFKKSSINYNKMIATELGIYSSIVLACLLERQNNEFFLPRDIIRFETGLDFNQQRKGERVLLAFKFIELEKRGYPVSNYYIINTENINTFLEDYTEELRERVTEKERISLEYNEFFKDLGV